MKKRWRGLCALWIVLALVIGTFPVAGAVEDVPESAAAAVSEDAGDGNQVPEESGSMENFAETDEGIRENDQTEETRNSEPTGEMEGISETALVFTASNSRKRTAIPARAAVAREAVATSANAWLYVGSGEVSDGMGISRSNDDGSVNGVPDVTIQFDVPFNSQSVLNSISVPEDKKLSGWRLWGLRGSMDSGTVEGSSLKELEIAGQISADEYNSFIGSSASDRFLLIEPLWRDVRDIWDGDSLEMKIGESCNLSEGSWQVADGNAGADTAADTTVYTEGRIVYAARSGTFIFSKHSSP